MPKLSWRYYFISHIHTKCELHAINYLLYIYCITSIYLYSSRNPFALLQAVIELLKPDNGQGTPAQSTLTPAQESKSNMELLDYSAPDNADRSLTQQLNAVLIPSYLSMFQHKLMMYPLQWLQIIQVMAVLYLSNDPCKVDSNFLCYAATGLSPHRNVIIFTQRMPKPTGRQLTQ